jgi:hypothetical protein
MDADRELLGYRLETHQLLDANPGQRHA